MSRIDLGVCWIALLIAYGMPQFRGHAYAEPSVAYYYGSALPAAALSQYDHVIVQADQADKAQVELLRRRGSEVFAYVSLSELSRAQASNVDRRWQLGSNANWNTVVMNAADSGFRRWLLDNCFAPLWQRGFHAFFLDNLDSYQGVVHTEEARIAQINGLSAIISELATRFPKVKLELNRGFELLPQIAKLATGLAAESLFQSWNPVTKKYGEVRDDDRRWLLNQLRRARDEYHLPITVIDYVPVTERELARKTAERIAALGMTPWVTDHDLTTLGVGTFEVIPRRILALYNGAELRGDSADMSNTPIHKIGGVIFEYLGYAIDYVDVSESLPSGALNTQYAGIVSWFTDDRVPNSQVYRDWLLRQINAGMKVLILDHLGFSADSSFTKRLGYTRIDRRARGDVRVLLADPELTGFETKVTGLANRFYEQRLEDSSSRRVLSVEDSDGFRMDAVFTAAWGGMAAHPYLLREGPVFQYRWLINPFAFFKQALRLPDIPAPDVTTLNGHRMLIVHIDGDGFASRAEMPGTDYAGKVILDRILKQYLVKTTVSVIEGEVGPAGKWPKLSPELEAIARDIFALPNVEVASHSYSHPFDWLRFGQDQEDGDINGMFRYATSLVREVNGSADYINRRLAPPNKPTKVFLWSGEAMATREALAQTYAAGLLNMNGGNTIISRKNPSLTVVWPMGRPNGPYYQVYAPMQNENLFTNLWHGPFYGFREVKSSFQLTDMPRRLKPINIYFHFYSGSKIGSLKALQEVMNWSLLQDVTSVYASEYIYKVLDFQGMTLARRTDGCWQVRGDGALTTLRLERGGAEVDRKRSKGITGVFDLPQGKYLSLDGSGRAVLCTSPQVKEHRAANP